MPKRKRERSDVESAGRAKHKRVKEHSEDNTKPEDHQNTIGTVPKSADARSTFNTEIPSTTLKRREAKLARKERKKATNSKPDNEDGLRPVNIIVKPTDYIRTPDADPSKSALLRGQDAKREKRREREQAGIPRAGDLGGVGFRTKNAVSEPLGKSKSRKKGHKEKSSTWKVSEASGGQMLDLDPLFSKDEE